MHFFRHSIRSLSSSSADAVNIEEDCAERHHTNLSSSCDCSLRLVEDHQSTQNGSPALENNLYWCANNSPNTYASSTSQWSNLPVINASNQSYPSETYEESTLPPDSDIPPAVPNQYCMPWNTILNPGVIYSNQRDDYYQWPETNMVHTNPQYMGAEMSVIGTLAPEWHLDTSSTVPSGYNPAYTGHQGWKTNSLPSSAFTVSGASQQARQHGNELDAYILENFEMSFPSPLHGGNATVHEYKIAPTVASERNFDGNIQRRFLDFVMKNRTLLSLVTRTSDSVEGMYAIQQAFEEDLRCQGLTSPHDDISKIFQHFRLAIGSALGQQEKNTRRIKETTANCPFTFCNSEFTRPAGLRNHLSAHFTLAPRQCPRCGKRLPDSSFKRHEGNCSSVLLRNG